MAAKLALGIAMAGALASGTAAAPDPMPWVEMTTGSSRIFLDTSSVTGSGTARAGKLAVIKDGFASLQKIELDCSKNQYRLGASGNWSSDDAANVRRTCTKNFAGMQRYSADDLNGVLAKQQAEPRWVEAVTGAGWLRFVDTRGIVPRGNTYAVRALTLYESSSRPDFDAVEINCTTGEHRNGSTQDGPMVPLVCKHQFDGLRLYSLAELKSYKAVTILKDTRPDGTYVDRTYNASFPREFAGLKRTNIDWLETKKEWLNADYRQSGPKGDTGLYVWIGPLLEESSDRYTCYSALSPEPTGSTVLQSRTEGRIRIDGREYLNFGASTLFDNFKAPGKLRARSEVFCDTAMHRAVHLSASGPPEADLEALLSSFIAHGPWPGRPLGGGSARMTFVKPANGAILCQADEIDCYYPSRQKCEADLKYLEEMRHWNKICGPAQKANHRGQYLIVNRPPPPASPPPGS